MTNDYYTRFNVSIDSLDEKLLELDIAKHLWSKHHNNNIDDDEDDPESQFKLHLSTKTDSIDINDSNISKINYRLINNNRSILLTPIIFNNNFNNELYQLKINLPDKILSNCIVINHTILNNESIILIDLIIESGLLITSMIKLKDFSTPTISSNNYSEWNKISNPYGFDIRKPHLLYSYNFNYILVFLKDGGLIALKRTNLNLLFEIEPIIFNDNSYLENLSNIFKLTKPWSNSNNSLIDSKISLKTVVDVIHYKDYLITITINKKLRVWSIDKQSLILEKNLIDLLNLNDIDNDIFLDSTPSKLLDLIEFQDLNYLSIYFPFNNGIFKIFKIESDFFKLIDIGLDLQTKSQFNGLNSIWLVADFKLIKEQDSKLALWILWKSNTSSIVKKLIINDNLSIEWIEISKHSNDIGINRKKKINSETWSEFYQWKIFQTGLYSNLILETSLSIFQSHFNNISNLNKKISNDDQSLLERITKTISESIEYFNPNNYDLTLSNQWKKFDSLCQEFKKQIDEPLNFLISNGSILLVNRLNYDYIREPPSIVDKQIDQSSNQFKLKSNLSKFVSNLPNDVLNNVKNSILQLINGLEFNEISIISEFSNIFETQLNNKFNLSNLNILVEELSNLGDLFQIIEEILKFQHYESNNIDNDIDNDIDNEDSKLSNLSLSILINSSKDIIQSYSSTLFELIILLLVLEFENKDKLQEIIFKILKIYKNYELVNSSFELGINRNGSLEIDSSIVWNNSIFTKIISTKFSKGFKFSNESLIIFTNSKILPFINTSEFFELLIIELYNSQNYHVIYTNFWEYFNNDPILQLFKGIVLLKLDQPLKSTKLFINNSSSISRFRLSSQNLEILKLVKDSQDLSVFFQSHLSKYYFNLSLLFEQNLKFEEALNFINLSISNQSLTEFDINFSEQRYLKLFEISLEISNYSIAKTALTNIKDLNSKKTALNKFIEKLYDNNELKKLNELNFTKDQLLIDEILYEKAINSSSPLFYFKVLYAFRLNYKDYRGSMEALYEYIQNYESSEEIKSNLYLTILNVISTLTKDDQWILKKLPNNEYIERTFDDLNKEYELLQV
ncbi:hypothetical protein WICMUC_001788 [Wickerhamomyces mucosus]|uniref:Uncharacterized protein n=1 Tax=Wickerhamomyces mucosus TaxID=1378264 RepID=A0A9P8PRX6_9ASCO|nr:hypothetical protein WICMUC_001788 [Wickerhamomyces mucosus]